MSIRNYFNSIEPHFEKGGKYEKYYPIFEMVETIFFTSKTVTKVAPHARSFVDMKRVMTYVVISILLNLILEEVENMKNIIRSLKWLRQYFLLVIL